MTTQKFRGIELEGSPTATVDGTMYFDAASGIFKARTGNAWVNASQQTPIWEDTFFGTNGVLIDSRASSGRGNLQRTIGAAGSLTAVIENDGNNTYARGNTGSTGAYLSQAIPASADYSVVVDILYKTSNGAFLGPVGRFNYATQNVGAGPSGNSGYVAGYASSIDSWQLYSFSNGSPTTLATAAMPLVANQTYRCRLEMIGTSIQVFVDDDEIPVISVTNSAHSGQGRGGLWFANASSLSTGLLASYAAIFDGRIAPTVNNDYAIVANGDSLLGGGDQAGNLYQYSPTIIQYLGEYLGTAKLWNYTADAKTMDTVRGEDATTMDIAYPGASTARLPIAYTNAGANDLNNGTLAVDIIADMVAWVTSMKADGYFTVISTVIKNAALSAGEETQRQALNAAIMAGSTGVDLVIDTASNPAFANTSYTAIFVDGVHLAPLGRRIYAMDLATGMKGSGRTFQKTVRTVGASTLIGKVAVAGTFTPQAPLSVFGAAGKRLGIYDDGSLWSGFSVAANQTIYAFGGTGANRFSFNVTDNGTELFTIRETGRVGIGASDPHASSALEIVSTSRGLLVSRMTKAQRDAISSPADGLIIYQTDNTPGFRGRENGAWVRFDTTADP